MKIIQVYNNDYEPIGLYDVSETNCPDDLLQQEFEKASVKEDSDKWLEDTWGIVRVFIEQEIVL